MFSKLKLSILCFYILCNSIKGYSQNYAQVTHTEGTQNVDGIMVTVTSSSFVFSTNTLCIDAFPYGIGWNLSSGNGSYTFNFYPAISTLSLNYSVLSNVTGHMEEIKLFKNGIHFPLATIGTKNSCDSLGIITSQGNLRACQGCPRSGWNGTIINGSISKLTVLDTVYIGQPGGATFSLFIYGNPLSLNENNAPVFDAKFSPNPFAEKSILKLPMLSDLSLVVYRNDGSLIENTNVSNLNKIIVSKDDYPTGIYYYQLRSNSTILSSGKLISN